MKSFYTSGLNPDTTQENITLHDPVKIVAYKNSEALKEAGKAVYKLNITGRKGISLAKKDEKGEYFLINLSTANLTFELLQSTAKVESETTLDSQNDKDASSEENNREIPIIEEATRHLEEMDAPVGALMDIACPDIKEEVLQTESTALVTKEEVVQLESIDSDETQQTFQGVQTEEAIEVDRKEDVIQAEQSIGKSEKEIADEMLLLYFQSETSGLTEIPGIPDQIIVHQAENADWVLEPANTRTRVNTPIIPILPEKQETVFTPLTSVDEHILEFQKKLLADREQEQAIERRNQVILDAFEKIRNKKQFYKNLKDGAIVLGCTISGTIYFMYGFPSAVETMFEALMGPMSNTVLNVPSLNGSYPFIVLKSLAAITISSGAFAGILWSLNKAKNFVSDWISKIRYSSNERLQHYAEAQASNCQVVLSTLKEEEGEFLLNKLKEYVEPQVQKAPCPDGEASRLFTSDEAEIFTNEKVLKILSGKRPVSGSFEKLKKPITGDKVVNFKDKLTKLKSA